MNCRKYAIHYTRLPIHLHFPFYNRFLVHGCESFFVLYYLECHILSVQNVSRQLCPGVIAIPRLAAHLKAICCFPTFWKGTTCRYTAQDLTSFLHAYNHKNTSQCSRAVWLNFVPSSILIVISLLETSICFYSVLMTTGPLVLFEH